MATLEAMEETALETQLTELCEIVMGIRLFHKHSQLGSEDLLDYHLLCENDATLLRDELRVAIASTARAVNALELTLLSSINNGAPSSSSSSSSSAAAAASSSSPSPSSPDGAEASPAAAGGPLGEGGAAAVVGQQKDELVNRHQLLMFLHILLSEAEEVLHFASVASRDFQSELAEVKDIVGGKTAVPKSQVYVCFRLSFFLSIFLLLLSSSFLLFLFFSFLLFFIHPTSLVL